MDNNPNKEICRVCGGKGGWHSEVNREKTYFDCHFCEGFGFHDAVESEVDVESFFLTYNLYRKKVSELLGDTIGRVDAYDTQDYGKTIEIRIAPYNKGVFGEFVKFILKLSHFSSKIKIHITQDFFYKQESDKYAFYWKIVLEPDELKDLEGFIDVVRFWDKKGGLY